MINVLILQGLFGPVLLIGNQSPPLDWSRPALELGVPPLASAGAPRAPSTPPGGPARAASLPLAVRPVHLSEGLA